MYSQSAFTTFLPLAPLRFSVDEQARWIIAPPGMHCFLHSSDRAL
ncbi:hypothetical protein [Fischerella sp. PCC 9605]|nr:hypothetical protein [Fischerella sp. PCC 9605]